MPATLKNAANKTIDLEYITFDSYARLCVLISVCLGFVVSIAFFVLDTFDPAFPLQWGFVALPGRWAGVVVLFVGPFILGVVGFLGALFTYGLFRWALRTFRDLPMTGTWTEIKRVHDLKTPA